MFWLKTYTQRSPIFFFFFVVGFSDSTCSIKIKCCMCITQIKNTARETDWKICPNPKCASISSSGVGSEHSVKLFLSILQQPAVLLDTVLRNQANHSNDTSLCHTATKVAGWMRFRNPLRLQDLSANYPVWVWKRRRDVEESVCPSG